MQIKKVTHIVLNEYNPDYRVMKEVHSLKKNYSVNIIAMNKKGSTKSVLEDEEGINVYRMAIVTRKLKQRIFLPFKFLETLFKGIRLTTKLKPDVIHCHDFSALPIGYIAKMFTKSKLIYDSHEFREDSNVTLDYPKIVNKITTKIEHFMGKRCDRIITVSPGIADLLESRMKSRKPAVILNAPYKRENTKVLFNIRNKFNINEKDLVFTYVGGILPTRGFELILEAYLQMNNSNVHLLLIGNEKLPDWLSEKFSFDLNNRNIHFIPPVYPTDVIGLASQADVGIHAIRGESLSHQYCMPNKLFEYIQSGLALLMTDLVELKKVINDNEVGLTFRDKQIDDLQQKMEYFVKNREVVDKYKSNSKKQAKIFHWDIEEDKLLKLYKDLETTI